MRFINHEIHENHEKVLDGVKGGIARELLDWGWMTSRKPLRDIISFKGGGTPSKQVSEYWGAGIPWATVKDFTSTSLSETQDFITEEGLSNSSANLISKGHVFIPTRMALGKAAINTIELLIDNEQITDERIIAEASSPERWHQEKAKIEPDKWPAALEWMRDNNLVPTGYGKHTRKLQ